MKKFLIGFMLLAFATVAHAERGQITNVFASWVNVSTTTTNIPLPYPSRDVQIFNSASTQDICLGLRGETMDQTCTATNNLTQLAHGQSIQLFDYVTTNITLRALSGTASPVSVIVTY